MADYDALLDQIPIGDIAKKLGIDAETAESAVRQVIPTIIGGMAENAKDGAGAKSIEKALTKHRNAPVKRAAVAEVDTDDGEKIVSNVFGSQKSKVVAAVADTNKSSLVTGDIIAKILPIVAPIVISWLASRFFTTNEPAAKPKPGPKTPAAPAASGGGIGDLLGGLLGGSGGKDVLGGVLGGLLGGGKR